MLKHSQRVGYICLQEFFMDHALQKLKGPQIATSVMYSRFGNTALGQIKVNWMMQCYVLNSNALATYYEFSNNTVTYCIAFCTSLITKDVHVT